MNKKEEFKWGARLKSVYNLLRYFNLLVHFHGLLVLSNIHIQIVIKRATYTLTNTLFVFSINGPKQNATSILTPGSDPAFYALSHGTLSFASHGISNNHGF